MLPPLNALQQWGVAGTQEIFPLRFKWMILLRIQEDHIILVIMSQKEEKPFIWLEIQYSMGQGKKKSCGI